MLVAGAAAGLAGAFPASVRASQPVILSDPFSGTGVGWDGFFIDGVANLRREDGVGVLEAGTDLYPADRRAVAFAADRRVRDASITARVVEGGVGPGVVLRRRGPRTWYAAVYDADAATLTVLARTPAGERTVALAPVASAGLSFELTLTATGHHPTQLSASLTDAIGAVTTAEGSDDTAGLQEDGDPGVLATARTGFAHGPGPENSTSAVLLTPQGVKFEQSPAGAERRERVRHWSTARFEQVVVSSAEDPRPTTPSVTAMASGVPVTNGARVTVTSDVPAEVLVEFASNAGFTGSRFVRAGRTDDFRAAMAVVAPQASAGRVYWRPWLRRAGRETAGPSRSFPVLSGPGGSARVRLAIGSCATQFTQPFMRIAEAQPDVLIWTGDLNYLDRAGPLAQTETGYAGLWTALLGTRELQPILERACFAPQRDDHDYGRDNLGSEDVPAYGIHPWDSIMGAEPYYGFRAGLADVFVLEQRRFRDPIELPDTPQKSLLGQQQREWLFEALAKSKEPFKVVCSPCPLHYPTNGDQGNWGAAYTGERDALLEHVERHVSGRTLFVTGDSHSAAVIRFHGFIEVRAAPLDMPLSHPKSEGDGVVFSESGAPAPVTVTGGGPRASQVPPIPELASEGVFPGNPGRFFCMLDILEADGVPTMDVALRRADGSTAYETRLQTDA